MTAPTINNPSLTIDENLGDGSVYIRQFFSLRPTSGLVPMMDIMRVLENVDGVDIGAIFGPTDAVGTAWFHLDEGVADSTAFRSRIRGASGTTGDSGLGHDPSMLFSSGPGLTVNNTVTAYAWRSAMLDWWRAPTPDLVSPSALSIIATAGMQGQTIANLTTQGWTITDGDPTASVAVENVGGVDQLAIRRDQTTVDVASVEYDTGSAIGDGEGLCVRGYWRLENNGITAGYRNRHVGLKTPTYGVLPSFGITAASDPTRWRLELSAGAIVPADTGGPNASIPSTEWDVPTVDPLIGFVYFEAYVWKLAGEDPAAALYLNNTQMPVHLVNAANMDSTIPAGNDLISLGMFDAVANEGADHIFRDVQVIDITL